jgi:uncharacterized protein YeeX (DUF496 family)
MLWNELEHFYSKYSQHELEKLGFAAPMLNLPFPPEICNPFGFIQRLKYQPDIAERSWNKIMSLDRMNRKISLFLGHLYQKTKSTVKKVVNVSTGNVRLSDDVATRMAQNLFRPIEYQHFKPRIIKKGRKLSGFMSTFNYETRKRLQKYLGSDYKKNDFSDNTFSKIYESCYDLYWLGRQAKIKPQKILDLLTVIRPLNEAIYDMDKYSEKQEDMNLWEGDELFFDRTKMLFIAVKLLHKMKKLKLAMSIPDLELRGDGFFLCEGIFNRPFIGWEDNRHASHMHEFLEPENWDYVDTGSYGRMMMEFFPRYFKDKESLLQVWNNSRRVTDVIDAIIDLKEDIEEGVKSGTLIHIYTTIKDEYDRRIIDTAVKNHEYNEYVRIVFEKYVKPLLGRLEDSVFDVKSDDLVTEKLKLRTLNLIELGYQIIKDPSKTGEYDKFYSSSLK